MRKTPRNKKTSDEPEEKWNWWQKFNVFTIVDPFTNPEVRRQVTDQLNSFLFFFKSDIEVMWAIHTSRNDKFTRSSTSVVIKWMKIKMIFHFLYILLCYLCIYLQAVSVSFILFKRKSFLSWENKRVYVTVSHILRGSIRTWSLLESKGWT